jgi:hypothetical protein
MGLPRGDHFAFLLEDPVEIVSAWIMEAFPNQQDGATATPSRRTKVIIYPRLKMMLQAQPKRDRKLPRA